MNAVEEVYVSMQEGWERAAHLYSGEHGVVCQAFNDEARATMPITLIADLPRSTTPLLSFPPLPGGLDLLQETFS